MKIEHMTEAVDAAEEKDLEGKFLVRTRIDNFNGALASFIEVIEVMGPGDGAFIPMCQRFESAVIHLPFIKIGGAKNLEVDNIDLPLDKTRQFVFLEDINFVLGKAESGRLGYKYADLGVDSFEQAFADAIELSRSIKDGLEWDEDARRRLKEEINFQPRTAEEIQKADEQEAAEKAMLEEMISEGKSDLAKQINAERAKMKALQLEGRFLIRSRYDQYGEIYGDFMQIIEVVGPTVDGKVPVRQRSESVLIDSPWYDILYYKNIDRDGPTEPLEQSRQCVFMEDLNLIEGKVEIGKGGYGYGALRGETFDQAAWSIGKHMDLIWHSNAQDIMERNRIREGGKPE